MRVGGPDLWRDNGAASGGPAAGAREIFFSYEFIFFEGEKGKIYHIFIMRLRKSVEVGQ